MTYAEVLQAIHGRKAFSSGPTLERIARLMHRLGDPQDGLRCVHVAGTNGKGSISAMVESALRQSGKRVGLFTSPYLVDFRERIQLDRSMISQERLVEVYQAVMAQERQLEAEGYEPVNEFELVTAMGFLAFAQDGVDYAVMEVGLGGRYDATNVIARPEVCCITSISLDHTAVLGGTIGQIAGEKAGILKPGCPVVLARQMPEARTVLLRRSEALGCPVVEAGECRLLERSVRGQRLEYRGQTLELPLLGDYQRDNAAAAWEVCRLLGLTPEEIVRGFRQVSWPGRLQYLPGPPALLIDAGHNPAGIQALCDTLDTLFLGQRPITVMAMMRDKDYAACIPMVARRSSVLIAATTGLPRSLPPEELEQLGRGICPTRCGGMVPQALELARGLAGPEQLILVCGSVYGAGEALGTLHP